MVWPWPIRGSHYGLFALQVSRRRYVRSFASFYFCNHVAGQLGTQFLEGWDWFIELVAVRANISARLQMRPARCPGFDAAMEILPPSSTFVAWINPSPSLPNHLWLVYATVGKISSAVSDARGLFSLLAGWKTGRSLFNDEGCVLTIRSPTSPVLTITTATVPVRACVIKGFLLRCWSPW